MEQGSVLRPTDAEAFDHCFSLNPFGTGQCLTTKTMSPAEIFNMLSQSLWNRAVSYDCVSFHKITLLERLNPFGTGQCLTTEPNLRNKRSTNVSIPLEQGSVLRPLKTRLEVPSRQGLNPFGTGQCLTTV